DDPDVKIYYEFMDFYKATKLNDIYFSKKGSFTTLMDLVGIEPGKVMDEDAKKDLVSSYLNFRTAYESRGGDRFDFPVGDAYLRFIHIHGYDNVKHMTSDEMDKNVAKTWEEFELISDNSGVELKMDPAKIEPAKKNILSYLLPISGGDSNKKLKVGFIYEKTPQTSEWCYAHELGRQYIDETFGKQIETVSITNVRPKIDDYDAIQKLIDENTDLIFVTSSAMMYASLKQAIAHPKAKILNCSLNISHKYIRTYYTRIHEAKYLTGLIAGVMSKSDRIGYVAGCPLYGVMANVNAFAMGVKAVNPDAKVYVEWNGIKDNDVEARFKELGINCISDQDMITPKKSSRKFGLYINDDGNIRHLAMPVWHWGVFYEKLIQSILSGSWKKEEEGDKVSALNYWWGMSSGAVDIIYGGGLNNETKKIVDLIRESIIKGEFHPFSGELRNQEGKIMNKAGETLDPDEIIEMDWLMDNIVGKIPEYDELSEEYKLLVINQGIIDVNE
uniref:BMP family ABC transporter substrate-binding protein n=1 Tax=Lachnospira sp. TaxID=2049031 RepID=UPI004026F579